MEENINHDANLFINLFNSVYRPIITELTINCYSQEKRGLIPLIRVKALVNSLKK